MTTTTTTRLLRTSSSSKLFEVLGTSYRVPPLLAKLKGSRRAVGNDYAALLHKESSDAMTAFLNSMFTQVEQEVLLVFLDFCWDKVHHTHSVCLFSFLIFFFFCLVSLSAHASVLP